MDVNRSKSAVPKIYLFVTTVARSRVCTTGHGKTGRTGHWPVAERKRTDKVDSRFGVHARPGSPKNGEEKSPGSWPRDIARSSDGYVAVLNTSAHFNDCSRIHRKG